MHRYMDYLLWGLCSFIEGLPRWAEEVLTIAQVWVRRLNKGEPTRAKGDYWGQRTMRAHQALGCEVRSIGLFQKVHLRLDTVPISH